MRFNRGGIVTGRLAYEQQACQDEVIWVRTSSLVLCTGNNLRNSSGHPEPFDFAQDKLQRRVLPVESLKVERPDATRRQDARCFPEFTLSEANVLSMTASDGFIKVFCGTRH